MIIKDFLSNTRAKIKENGAIINDCKLLGYVEENGTAYDMYDI